MLTPKQLKKRREERARPIARMDLVAEAMSRHYVLSGRYARYQAVGLKNTRENQLFRCKTSIGEA